MADQLFVIQDIGPCPGMPDWANLRTVDQPGHPVDDAALQGPGIYAMLLDGEVFYIGLHAPLDEPVSIRWRKHLVTHTLRASRMFMKRTALLNSLMLPGPVGAGLRDTLTVATQAQLEELGNGLQPRSVEWHLAMQGLALADDNGPCAPLVTRSFNTIFNKARFAEANWNLFGPGNEDQILSHITLGYERLPGGPLFANGNVKFDWLKPRELDLIKRFRPICNSETAVGDELYGVTWPEIQEAIQEAFAVPNPYVPYEQRHEAEAHVAA